MRTSFTFSLKFKYKSEIGGYYVELGKKI